MKKERNKTKAYTGFQGEVNVCLLIVLKVVSGVAIGILSMIHGVEGGLLLIPAGVLFVFIFSFIFKIIQNLY